MIQYRVVALSGPGGPPVYDVYLDNGTLLTALPLSHLRLFETAAAARGWQYCGSGTFPVDRVR